MYRPTTGVTPEGYPSIGLCTLTTLVFAILGCWFMALVFLLLTAFTCHFFRDPERVVPTKADIAVSPADGKIINISTKPDPFTGEQRTYLAIFMNVFSVHVNRAPVEGTVTDIAYHPGLFVNASFDKASRDNERCAYALQDKDKNHWTFVQIAGLVARRIVCGVEPKVTLQRGERFGMIKFGSRVDVYLPESYRSTVHIGQQVFAGQSIIAEKKE